MGNFNISIEGVGMHHNRNTQKDANRMAKKFIEDMKSSGHSIVKATITTGSADDLLVVDYSQYDDKGVIK